MRIVYVLTSLGIGGAERLVLGLARRMADHALIGGAACSQLRFSGAKAGTCARQPSFGLRNIEDRLHLYFGDRGALRIGREDSMTVVAIEFPAQRAPVPCEGARA